MDLINYGKQAAVFTETLVHALNITFYDYWNVTTKLTKITGNADLELEMTLTNERKDKDRQTVFLKVNDLYQLDKPGISRGKDEDNIYFFESSSLIC